MSGELPIALQSVAFGTSVSSLLGLGKTCAFHSSECQASKGANIEMQTTGSKRMTKWVVAIVASIAFASALQTASAQNISVVVNGQPIQFDQPPIERSGRVFVPLRGVFENLGASVVYDNGVINATGNGTTVQLHIGSTDALVNGNTQQLDVAPFEVGDRTFVPLRFVSQALGATVDYNDDTQTVTIASSGSGQSGVTLTSLHPWSGGTVSTDRPGVSGSFSAPVNPNSVHITLDGRDVSETTDISSSGFLFTPSYALMPGSHTVRVTGQSQNGSGFDQSWSFTSGGNSQGNYFTNLQPTNGATVGNSFTVSGTTLPNSSVHIVVTPQAIAGGFFTISQGTFVATVQADSYGNFQQPVTVATLPGGTVSVRITSIAPATSASQSADLTLHS